MVGRVNYFARDPHTADVTGRNSDKANSHTNSGRYCFGSDIVKLASSEQTIDRVRYVLGPEGTPYFQWLHALQIGGVQNLWGCVLDAHDRSAVKTGGLSHGGD